MALEIMKIIKRKYYQFNTHVTSSLELIYYVKKANNKQFNAKLKSVFSLLFMLLLFYLFLEADLDLSFVNTKKLSSSNRSYIIANVSTVCFVTFFIFFAIVRLGQNTQIFEIKITSLTCQAYR